MRGKIIIWGGIGALPGTILLILTGPVSGEIELTLGVGGIFLIIAGAITGIILARNSPVS